jgi:hypothetical protein
MVSCEKTEIVGRFGQIEKQLKKLEDEVKGQFQGLIGKLQGFNDMAGFQHLDVSISKGRLYRISVYDHFI